MERSERRVFIQNYHRCCTGFPGQGTLIRSGKSGPTVTPEALENARRIKKRDEMIRNKMIHIAFNLLFLWMTYSLCYTNSDSRSINLYRDISQRFLTPYQAIQFEQIRTASDFMDWLEQTAVPTLFPEKAINGMNLHWSEKEFMEGYTSYRLGPPRLRQVRCREAENCLFVTGKRQSCYSSYDINEEEDADYCIGWKSPPCQITETFYNFSAEAWRYMPSSAIDGIAINGLYNFYGGGGYVASLDVNREVSFSIINEIRQTDWIDRQTRAVFFEFTLYCANLNIFSYNMFLVEFLETGGAITFYDIVPLRLDVHVGVQGIYTLVCELVYIVVLAALGIYVTRRFYKLKKKALNEPDTVLDLIWVIVSIIALIMYLNRMAMINEAIAKFNSDKRRFVNFYNIAVGNKLFQVCISILVFIATIRLLYIMGYNKRVHGIIMVFEKCGHELFWFGVFFFYLLLIYAMFGYLLFGSRLESYMNIFRTLGTLFISMIGKSRFTEIDATDPIMAKIYFMLMIVFLVYVILTIFLAILDTSIEWVHQQTKHDRSDEVVEFIINRFQTMLGKFRRKVRDEGVSKFDLPTHNSTAGQMCTYSIQSQKSVESMADGKVMGQDKIVKPSS
ncbi:hypothetical protein CHS0354_028630 [Potamilus streckersoni]|uniref:Uncharacterized protein n=1 Tax=Potamilus streckersoni TaxID=2493646 RepID=A0AAE0SX72_9BIVA|nr:hypothetical protein CHS0354_028630 [Potamilus streckersoni]